MSGTDINLYASGRGKKGHKVIVDELGMPIIGDTTNNIHLLLEGDTVHGGATTNNISLEHHNEGHTNVEDNEDIEHQSKRTPENEIEEENLISL